MSNRSGSPYADQPQAGQQHHDTTAFTSLDLFDSGGRQYSGSLFDWRAGLRNIALLTVLILVLSTTLQALFGHTFLTVALSLTVAYAVLIGGTIAGLLACVAVLLLLLAVHFAPHWIPELNDAGVLTLVIELLSATAVLLIAASVELRRQLGLQIRFSRQRLEHKARLTQRILDNLGPPIFVTVLDADGDILEMNQRVLDLSGAGRDELIGQSFSETSWWAEDDARQAVRAAIGQGLLGHASRFDVRAQGAAGPIWVDFSIEPLYADDGQVRFLVASGTSVTEHKQAEQRLGGVVEAVPTALIMVDRQGVIQLVNGNVCNLFGYQRHELLGDKLDKLLPATVHSRHQELMEGYFRNPRPRMMGAGRELHGVHVDGHEIPIEIGLSPIFEGDDMFTLAAISDISERIKSRAELEELASNLDAKVKQRTADLQHSNARLQRRSQALLLVNELSALITGCKDESELCHLVAGYQERLFPTSSGGVYLDYNQTLQRVAAWGDASLIAERLTHEECWALRRGRLHLVNRSEKGMACRHIDEPETQAGLDFTVCVPLSAGDSMLGLLHCRFPAGEDYPKETQEEAQLLLQGVAEHAALALANLHMRTTLRDQAIRDPLTGLYNRRYLDSTASRLLGQVQRYKQPLSVLVADLDRFKTVNDTLGHDVGDLVLQRVAATMVQQLREVDLLCRYGGEEFIVVLPDADVAQAAQVAERIRAAIDSTRMPQDVHITLSLGVAAFGGSDQRLEDTIARADEAMYQAKRTGRDRVCHAEDSDSRTQTG